MKKKGIIKVCIALVLVFCMIASNFSQVVSAVNPDYIKEVRLSWDMNDSAKAENWLKDNGYTVVPGNLNAGTKKGYCYLGYKTTKNKDEAITDMSIMSMDSGYKMYDYTTVIKEIADSTNRLAAQMLVALGEFRENYKAGSPNAKLAVEALNMVQVDQNDATPLGNYLLQEERTQEDIYNILLMGNNMVVSLIYNEITIGVSDYKMVEIEVEKPVTPEEESKSESTTESSEESTTESGSDVQTPPEIEKIIKMETWMDRLSEMGPYEAEEDVDNGDDDLYYEQARELLDAFEAYANDIKAAQKRKEKNGGEVVVNITTEKEAEAEDERIAAGGEINESNSDALNLGSYELLKQYKFGETNLAEYFVSLGDEDVKVQDIYPIVKSMTPGQISMLRICGVTTSVVATNNTEENYKTAMKELQKNLDKLDECKNGKPLHVYSGVNREVFSKEIAITERGYRESASGAMFDALTKEDVVGQNIEVAAKILAAITVASIGVSIIALTISSIVFQTSISIAATALWSTMTATAGFFIGAMSSFGPLVVAAAAVAALLIIGVIYVVRWATKLYDKYHPSYSPIPTDMYDTKNGEFIAYDVVLDHGDRAADLNNWAAQRWNALYVSYDSKAGSPLVVNPESNEIFRVTQGSQTVPNSMDSVKHFGQKSAMNLNTHAYKDKVHGVYLYYYTEDTLAGVRDYVDSGKYLSALVVASNKNAATAKAEIQKQEGYTVLDINLTPNDGKATYIGYQTTSRESQAITDIRFSSTNTQSISHGTSATNTYGNAGEINGLYLYYSKSKAVGEPILADLQVVDSFDSAPEDYEPVNLFNGGPAVNCGLFSTLTFSTVERKNLNKEATLRRYIYFRYENSPATEETYLSGIGFVSRKDELKGGSTEDSISQLGWIDSGVYMYSVTDNSGGGGNKCNRASKLVYYTTNNPKRAAYAIRTFEGEPKAPSLSGTITLDGNGFNACDTIAWDYVFINSVYNQKRYVKTTHAFLDAATVNNSGEFNPPIPEVTRYYKRNPFNKTSAEVKYQRPMMGLYVSGPISGAEPIKMSDFYIGKKAGAPSHLKPVVAMEDCYGKTPIEIGVNTGVYIYYNQTYKEKLEYIKDVEVVYYDTKNMAMDMCKYDLLSKGGDEIIDFNLASSSGHIFLDQDGGAYKKNYENRAAFLRITRTNRKSDALQDIRLYYVGKDDPEPAKTITIDGVTYTKRSNRIKGKDDYLHTYVDNSIKRDMISKDSYFYVYTAKIGQPMTDIRFDNKHPLVGGLITALDQNGKTSTDRSWWLHMSPHASNSKSYKFVDNVYVASGKPMDDSYTFDVDGIRKDKNAAINCELLSNGCTDSVGKDFNFSRKDDQQMVYIGYSLTNAKKKKVDGVVKDVAITDLITDKSYKSSIKKNGCTYYPASKCDLNVSVGGDYIYLYYTTDTKVGSPLTDFFPAYNLKGFEGLGDTIEKWEYVQKSGGGASNLNAGAYYKKGCKKKSLDAIYLLYRRVDNTTKSGAVLTASAFSDFKIVTIVGMAAIMVLFGGVVLVIKKSKEKKAKVSK